MQSFPQDGATNRNGRAFVAPMSVAKSLTLATKIGRVERLKEFLSQKSIAELRLLRLKFATPEQRPT
jgi:hypothetical protein